MHSTGGIERFIKKKKGTLEQKDLPMPDRHKSLTDAIRKGVEERRKRDELRKI